MVKAVIPLSNVEEEDSEESVSEDCDLVDEINNSELNQEKPITSQGEDSERKINDEKMMYLEKTGLAQQKGFLTWKSRTLQLRDGTLRVLSKEKVCRTISLQGASFSFSKKKEKSEVVLAIRENQGKKHRFSITNDEQEWIPLISKAIDRASKDYLQCMPIDIIHRIFMELSAQELQTMACTCQRFYHVLASEADFWRRWFCSHRICDKFEILKIGLKILNLDWKWASFCLGHSKVPSNGRGFCREGNRSYFGEFKNGYFHGVGIRYNSVLGSLYSGEWHHGLSEGNGTLIDSNGDRYDGSFYRGVPHGFVNVTHMNGNVYKGFFQNGRRHGKGELTLALGKKYVGEFENGILKGKGILSHPNGNIYEGDFSNGQRHGFGILKYSNGNIYEGEFQDGRCWGKGTLRYSNGDIYEGEFRVGKCDGKGKLTYKSGLTYEGEFKKGKFSGEGVLLTPFLKYEGEFKKGKFDGKGKIVYANGNKYEGEFKRGKFEGRGTLSLATGFVYKGEFVKGKREGIIVVTHMDDPPFEVVFNKGKPQPTH